MTGPRPARRAGALLLAAVVGLGLAGCSGDDGPTDGDGDDAPSPEEVLAEATALLTETSGVRLTLSTDDDPDTSAFLRRAEGVITDAPAFEGSAEGTFRGVSAGVDVISVDGTFYAQLPVVGWQEQDPEELCAPDPALLLDDVSGVPSVLTEATDVTAGEAARAEDDNTVVITPYEATVPGSAITNVLPCAPGDSYEATFTIDDEGRLRGAELTGEFFSGAGDVTYTIAVTEYDVEQEITAP